MSAATEFHHIRNVSVGLSEVPRVFEAVVFGGSAGMIEALGEILPDLKPDSGLKFLLVSHIHGSDTGRFVDYVRSKGPLPCVDATDKMPVSRGRIHLAPAGYHLLVEREQTLALSADDPVWFARPSIDVLFESCARVWGKRLIAVLFSGSSGDGVNGLAEVKHFGGLTLAQDPCSTQHATMPDLALNAGVVDCLFRPSELAGWLNKVSDLLVGNGARL